MLAGYLFAKYLQLYGFIQSGGPGKVLLVLFYSVILYLPVTGLVYFRVRFFCMKYVRDGVGNG